MGLQPTFHTYIVVVNRYRNPFESVFGGGAVSDERGRRLVRQRRRLPRLWRDCGGRDGDRGCAEHHRTGPEGIGVGRALGAH